MRAYRSTLLLCVLILLGWLWDFALGGGVVHSVGWLLALVLIGGISGLSVWSRNQQQHPDAMEIALIEPSESHRIRPARAEDLPELIEIEVAADQLFPLAGYGETPEPAELADLQHAAALLVTGDPPIGYARVEVLDGQAHLESLSVRPKFMRQGHGSALVNAALAWAAQQGYERMTLTTFADVAWNGPFYRRLGFVELTDLTPGLAAVRAAEAELGLDAMGRRIVMVHPIERLEP